MAQRRIARRELLRLSAGVSAGMVLGGRAAAQAGQTIDILGLSVPTEIAGIGLPAKPLNLLKTIAAIIELEKSAEQRRLPRSSLAVDTTQQLPVNGGTLYQAALPRLVSLIDRSETADPGLSDQAGQLLSELNESEHTTPDALKPAPLTLSRRYDFPSLKIEYRTLFDTAATRPEHAERLDWHVNAMKSFRERYEKLGSDVGVPWWFIGAIHTLEASLNFRAHLHNGDHPLSQRTRQVPAGRPLVWLPPSDWESSAKDALKLLGFTRQTDWSIERALHRLEAYNGFGYRKVGVPSPYLWSFSNHYESGKFVRDGKWNPKAKSQQCGAAMMIKALSLSGDVSFG